MKRVGGDRTKLSRYRRMRDFGRTAEPNGEVDRSENGRSFVVQEHDARRLHYDLRLELDGVLVSWAVPKGPSLTPGERRLAIQTEDHPIGYREFEGTIPKGQYGAGSVIIWDRGTWTPIGDPREGLRKGHLDFELDGERLHGRFLLVRTSRDDDKPSWLLIKRTDAGSAEEEAEGPAELPPFGSIAPELAVLVDDVPKAGPWIYEIKYDGYRTMAWLDHGEVRMASRRGHDWTTAYAGIAHALSRVRARTAIFDGEVTYLLEDGRTDFQRLQRALFTRAAAEQARLVYFVFDLLFHDGVDLRGEPLSFRKDRLRTILAGEGPPLMMSDHVESGAAFLREVRKAGLEGIIGKRADRPYRSKRSPDWIKIKLQRRQELVIVGYTREKGTRAGVGALLLGVHEDGALRYAGKVGTGFSSATLEDLSARLGAIEIEAPPVVDPPRTRAARWVRPELVCQVRFTEWTSDGALRSPSFEGLRLDKPARDVHRELSRPPPKAPSRPRVRDVVVTHPERVMDAAAGLTKLDLVRYADAVADAMLPYAAKRPLMLLRCPGGAQAAVPRPSGRRNAGKGSSCFVQKHSGHGVGAADLGSTTVGGEEVLYVTSAKQIVLLAQNNAVELHGWGSTLPEWERPDWIVFDLDPDEALPFARVVDGALELRDALKTLGLESWVKTTGGKGLHLVVPIARRYDWSTVRRAAEQIAVLMAHAAPDRYVANMSKRARAGRIFVDYLRNAEGATAVLPYSARARLGLPVALPIPWKELRAVDPAELTIATVPRLLARRRVDPWADLLGGPQTLPRELLASSMSGDRE